MTQEEKAKAYDEALERMKSWVRGEHPECFTEAQKTAEFIFPELKESEDEKIRKALIRFFGKFPYERLELYGVSTKEAIAWLEKQGEQTLDDKIKPKFNVGDWVVLSTSDGEKVVQIDSIEYFKSGEPRYITSEDRWFGNGTKAHLWTIQDAKDGDVLAYSDGSITLFKKLCNDCDGIYIAHVLYVDGHIETNNSCAINNVHPATKEQRDFLFTKMKEIAYENLNDTNHVHPAVIQHWLSIADGQVV